MQNLFSCECNESLAMMKLHRNDGYKNQKSVQKIQPLCCTHFVLQEIIASYVKCHIASAFVIIWNNLRVVSVQLTLPTLNFIISLTGTRVV
ncbi:hypothetical protein T10_3153 [Trichinella papuae]|uniref:Uncharacterized protein n=1 Tax=Trichinella papuae TaxID=268474 RepID=A0A0V1MTT1_9BILA|nr:hypothetical protein T10_3153 [Trichinella papuae]